MQVRKARRAIPKALSDYTIHHHLRDTYVSNGSEPSHSLNAALPGFSINQMRQAKGDREGERI